MRNERDYISQTVNKLGRHIEKRLSSSGGGGKELLRKKLESKKESL
jgi:hypothetical protein